MPTLVDKWGFLSFYCITLCDNDDTHIHTQKSIIKRNHRKLLNKKKTNSNFSGIFSFFAFKKITMTTKF